MDNLPQGRCVEVPCLVNGNGIQPTHVGKLPTQLAALKRTNINVQELIVEASLTGSTEAVYHAVMLDQICDMVSELLNAQANWLPQFKQSRQPVSA